MPKYASDQDLIAAVCAGCEQAAHTFFTRYRPLTAGLAVGRFKFSDTEVEDLFNQLIMILWQRDFHALRAWRGRGRFSTYLTVIVLNLCHRQLKTESRTQPLDEQQLAQQVSTEPSPEQHAASCQDRMQLEQVLAELSARDRLLIKLRYHDDCSPQQIGQVLGITGGSVRKAVFDALRRLRKRWPDLA